MTVKANFIQVLGSLVEPNLKLIISPAGGPEYAVGFRVTHDPEIGPDNLTMPRPAKMILTGDSPPFPPVVFKSDRAKQITVFSAETSEIQSELKVAVHTRPELDSRLIARARISGDNPYELLHAVLVAAAELPQWDELASWSRPTITEVGLYIERTAAVKLSRNSSFPFDRRISGDVLIVKREVRK